MTDKLTPKREKFCLQIVKGLSLSDAYRKSYDTKRMKDETINNEASKLMQNPAITARVNELRGKIEEKLAYSALESFKNLEKAQSIALELVKMVYHNGSRVSEDSTPDLSSFIKAEELKGKLSGLYVDRKEIGFSGDLKEKADVIRRRLFEPDKE